jgi:hypothetical protein
MCSAIATREQVFRARLECFRTRDREAEGIRQSTNYIERACGLLFASAQNKIVANEQVLARRLRMILSLAFC